MCLVLLHANQTFSVTPHDNTPAVLKDAMILEIDRLILESMQALKEMGLKQLSFVNVQMLLYISIYTSISYGPLTVWEGI